MADTYTLIYADCSDNLNGDSEVMAKCLKQKNHYSIDETIDDRCDIIRNESVSEIIAVLKLKCKQELQFSEIEIEKFFDEKEEVIRQEIYERDDSNPIEQIINNSAPIPVRIEMLSNYDCINSHWFESSGGYCYEDSYFGDMVDALNLNPAKVKELLLANMEKTASDFPDKSSRNGNEQVSYEDFYQELINSCCGANLLTYLATIDIREIYDAEFKIAEIVIPKENCCGLFSSALGGGSMLEMRLKQDVIIKLEQKNYNWFRLAVDNEGSSSGYSIKNTYGVYDSFFGKPLEVLKI